jgi:hypothetical protein
MHLENMGSATADRGFTVILSHILNEGQCLLTVA